MNRNLEVFKMFCRMAERGAGNQLFHDDWDLLDQAFEQSLIGREMPGFWLEVPLAKEKYTDLHVCFDREQLKQGVLFQEGAGFGYQSLFDWFIEEDSGGIGLDLAHDLHGQTGLPAAYVNVNHAPLDDTAGFFKAAGQEQLARPVLQLMDRLPDDMAVWYLGVFPSRPSTPARIGIAIGDPWQKVMRSHPEEFVCLLRSLGFEAVTPEMTMQMQVFAKSTYKMEMQLDVYEDGRIGDVFSLDWFVPVASGKSVRESFAKGTGLEAMQLLESWGIVDERWKRVPEAAFAQLAPLPDEDGQIAMYLLRCSPIFIKAKWQAGRLCPGKMYLQCEARRI